LLKTPNIILLDESTSAIDSAIDSAIEERIQTVFGRTMFVIAQIIERGAHREHIDIGDKHHELWTKQTACYPSATDLAPSKANSRKGDDNQNGPLIDVTPLDSVKPPNEDSATGIGRDHDSDDTMGNRRKSLRQMARHAASCAFSSSL
jgi:hypothetical protein